ncbi:MAG: hypothetical protein M3350_07215 [Actinomycetota bacterium]|nr:hypothetical protein [Actinomycetota bacterium]
MAGVGFVDPEEDDELLEEPSSLLLEDLGAGPPSETIASAESASPRAASPPRRAVCDLKLNVTQVPPG